MIACIKTATRAKERWVIENTDTELVERAQQGDEAAFGTLVERHQTLTYNLAYRFMRNPEAAQDMTQEAFVKAYRSLRRFRGDCKFSSWLYRITSSVCLTELSKRKRRGEVPLEDHHVGSVDTRAAISDMPELIRRCVAKLPTKYAQVITLYYLEEIPYEQVAEVLDIPMGTLKTWMHRARKALRAIVEKELD